MYMQNLRIFFFWNSLLLRKLFWFWMTASKKDTIRKCLSLFDILFLVGCIIHWELLYLFYKKSSKLQRTVKKQRKLLKFSSFWESCPQMPLPLRHTFPGWLHHPKMVFKFFRRSNSNFNEYSLWRILKLYPFEKVESHSGSDQRLPRKIKGSVSHLPKTVSIKPFDNISSTETLPNAFSH